MIEGFLAVMDDGAGALADVVIVGAADGRARAVEALRVAGGRAVAELEWAEVRDGLGRQPVTGAILLEMDGADNAVLATALPRIDTLSRSLDLPVVAALAAAQIDLAAAMLAAPRVQLLVEPATIDRVAALALVKGRPPATAWHDASRDAEAARLQRLNEEVARIAETLARLTRQEGGGLPATGVADRSSDYAGPPMEAAGGEVQAADLRGAIRSRRLRDQVFGKGLFEDPAWDMLLDLFAAELEGTQVSVSSLCIAAAVAPTTALRWIAKMTEAGLLERRPDPFDRRRAFMALTAKAREGMRSYCEQVRRAGLAIA